MTATQKTVLRQAVLAARARLGPEKRSRASAEICAKILVLEKYQNAHTLAAFCPMPQEVDIWPVLEDALTRGKTLALPRVSDAKNRKITFHQVLSRTSLCNGYKGILEPPQIAPLIKSQSFDFLLIPAVAIDKNKKRLGYGGGFYDIFLSQFVTPFLCSPVFRCQLVNDVAAETHDKSVDITITE